MSLILKHPRTIRLTVDPIARMAAAHPGSPGKIASWRKACSRRHPAAPSGPLPFRLES